MDVSNNTLNGHVKFNSDSNNRGSYNTQYQPRRVGLNINHVKFDLLKISELYDGLLTEDLGRLPLKLYNQYLTDLCNADMIYSYSIDNPELRTHEASGQRNFTYTVNVQGGKDRAPKDLKIHVGIYSSPMGSGETIHQSDGKCCMPNRLQ